MVQCNSTGSAVINVHSELKSKSYEHSTICILWHRGFFLWKIVLRVYDPCKSRDHKSRFNGVLVKLVDRAWWPNEMWLTENSSTHSLNYDSWKLENLDKRRKDTLENSQILTWQGASYCVIYSYILEKVGAQEEIGTSYQDQLQDLWWRIFLLSKLSSWLFFLSFWIVERSWQWLFAVAYFIPIINNSFTSCQILNIRSNPNHQQPGR